MFRLFSFLLSGCWHVWKETERRELVDDADEVIGQSVYCTCTKCGTPKRFKL